MKFRELSVDRRDWIFGLAKEFGWHVSSREFDWMIRFRKSFEYGKVTMDIHWNKKRDRRYTVSTHMDHPKKGKNKLYRKGVVEKKLRLYFENPRHHSSKGYRKKKKWA